MGFLLNDHDHKDAQWRNDPPNFSSGQIPIYLARNSLSKNV